MAHCTSGLNPFVTTPVSADCLSIVDAQLNTTNSLTQRIAEVNFQGGGFDLPGGQTRFAIGADYRFDGIAYRPDAGMQAANIDTFAAGIFGANPVTGGEHFGEEYLEGDLPLLGNLPAVKKLVLNVGYRHSDFKSGDATGNAIRARTAPGRRCSTGRSMTTSPCAAAHSVQPVPLTSASCTSPRRYW